MIRTIPALGLALLALGACAPTMRPHGVAVPSATVAVVANAPVTTVRPGFGVEERMAIHQHPTHPSVAYAPVTGCVSANTAYAMHEMAGKYECSVLYNPGTLTSYRFSVFRDAHGRAYTTDAGGRWKRNPAYDGYVAGDQPHR